MRAYVHAGMYVHGLYVHDFENLSFLTDTKKSEKRGKNTEIKPKKRGKTAKSEVSNGKICLKGLPLEEQAILEVIIAKPEITQKEIASKIGKSERTVRNKINSLKEKGILERVNGRRNTVVFENVFFL